MANILILYSSMDGHTVAICLRLWLRLRLRQIVEQEGHSVKIASVNDVRDTDLAAAFDNIVMGASIRHGRHRPEVYAFMKA